MIDDDDDVLSTADVCHKLLSSRGVPDTVPDGEGFPSLEDRIAGLLDQRDALAKFKDWVHTYLDSKGIPTHPDGPHSKEGCRIGDRMDLVFAERDEARDGLRKCWDAAGLLCDRMTGQPWQHYDPDSVCCDLVPQIEHLSGQASAVEEAEAQSGRLLQEAMAVGADRDRLAAAVAELRAALESYVDFAGEDNAHSADGAQGGIWLDGCYQTVIELQERARAALVRYPAPPAKGG